MRSVFWFGGLLAKVEKVQTEVVMCGTCHVELVKNCSLVKSSKCLE